MTDNKYILGVDIGGTNIRAGLVNADYQLYDFVIVSSTQIMDNDNSIEKLFLFIMRYLEEHASDKNIMAISIGFPSTIDKSRNRQNQ